MSRDGYLPPGVTQAQIDRAHEGDEPPACPTCGGSGMNPPGSPLYDVDFWGRGSGRLCGWTWAGNDTRSPARCLTCRGSGRGSGRDPCPYRHFTPEEEAAWARVFEGVK